MLLGQALPVLAVAAVSSSPSLGFTPLGRLECVITMVILYLRVATFCMCLQTAQLVVQVVCGGLWCGLSQVSVVQLSCTMSRCPVIQIFSAKQLQRQFAHQAGWHGPQATGVGPVNCRSASAAMEACCARQHCSGIGVVPLSMVVRVGCLLDLASVMLGTAVLAAVPQQKYHCSVQQQ